jgi:hypothetical protein
MDYHSWAGSLSYISSLRAIGFLGPACRLKLLFYGGLFYLGFLIVFGFVGVRDY